jgi:hypothetical protein
MQISKRAGLGLALACLMGSMMAKPAAAADKVSLFKVITARDEIVIGLSVDELAQMDGNAAEGGADRRGEEMTAGTHAARHALSG